jgi:hypothetical protein
LQFFHEIWGDQTVEGEWIVWACSSLRGLFSALTCFTWEV